MPTQRYNLPTHAFRTQMRQDNFRRGSYLGFPQTGRGGCGEKKRCRNHSPTLTRVASLHVRQTRGKREGVVHRGRKSARGDVHSPATPSLPQCSVFDSSLVLLWPGRASCRDGMFDIFLMIRSDLILCSDWLMDVHCSP